MRVFLDNCAFNRPFDDLSQHRIRVESDAKLLIQHQIENSGVELVWSYVNDTENLRNPISDNRLAILSWKEIAVEVVVESDLLLSKARLLSTNGLKSRDALHISAAAVGGADIFVTTDDGILKKLAEFESMLVLNPVNAITAIEAYVN